LGLTFRTVVADAEPSVRATEDGSVWAVLGGASNGLGALPHNLGEVEVLGAAHGWAGLAVEGLEVVDLAIVPAVGDRIRNDRGLTPALDGVGVTGRIDVLAVASVALVPARIG
jgi:hypothetical protein